MKFIASIAKLHRSLRQELQHSNSQQLSSFFSLTCDQAFFFRRRAKEKQRETRRSVGQSSFSPTLALLYFRVDPKKERLTEGYQARLQKHA